ncbi:MAG: ATP-grasp domain-containing protein [Gammaproteobacteria bacterium]
MPPADRTSCDRPIVVVAQSGRALARSAARSGLPVHVLDLYADGDTCALSRSVSRIGSIVTGFSAERLLDRLHRIEGRKGIGGIVAGSGFEDRIELLETMGRVGRLLGNPPEVVRRAKDPACFFPLLVRLGIPHPETITGAPVGPVFDARGWLCKRIGGAGGAHVRPAKACCPPGHYLQRQVPGRPHSVVFLADGRHAAMVGYNEIRVQGGTGATRFRYAGAVTVSEPPAAPTVEDAVQALVPALGLVGLCGLDFMLDEDGRYSVLEVNPRPTATFELYEDLDDHGPGLFQLHVAACQGRLPRAARSGRGGVAAQEVLFASETFAIPGGLQWPDWARDRPADGTIIQAGEPICTLHARAAQRKVVDRLLSDRRANLSAVLGWPQAA